MIIVAKGLHNNIIVISIEIWNRKCYQSNKQTLFIFFPSLIWSINHTPNASSSSRRESLTYKSEQK